MGVARLFVGVYPQVEVAARMVGLLEGVVLPAHRVAAVEQVHMTVHFVGDVDTRQMDEVRESVERSVAGLGSFWLKPRRLVVLPEKGPGRLVALEMEEDATLMEIHRRLVHRLARSKKQREEGRFWPHITLARFVQQTVVGVVEGVEREVEMEAFEVGAVRLMQSVLKNEGAEHRVVEVVNLQGGR